MHDQYHPEDDSRLDPETTFIFLAESRVHHGPTSNEFNQALLAVQLELQGMTEEEASRFKSSARETYDFMRDMYTTPRIEQNPAVDEALTVTDLDDAWNSFEIAFRAGRSPG